MIHSFFPKLLFCGTLAHYELKYIVIADLKKDIFLVIVVQDCDGGRELPLVFLQRASIASIENEKKKAF